MDELGAARASIAATGIVILIYSAVWITTGSVAALSELAHVLVDVVGVATSYLAVRASLKPPDLEHPYGHQKADALGGLLGSIVVLVAAGLVAYEAVERLLAWETYTPDLGATAAVAGAIVVDVSRVRVLRRFKHSRALSADALHFATDAVASSAVLALFVAGLALEQWSAGLFREIGPLIDVAVAAGITAVFVRLSLRSARGAALELLDYSPPQLRDEAARLAKGVEGVVGVGDVKLRKAGPVYHGEVVIKVKRDITIEEAHKIADRVERRLERKFGGRFTVHVEPAELPRVPDCCDVVLAGPSKIVVYLYDDTCRVSFPGFDVELRRRSKLYSSI